MSGRISKATWCAALTVWPVVTVAQTTSTPWAEARAREIAAARREHIPIEPKDLDRPMPPPDQNAATYYAQLAALSKSRKVPSQDFEVLEAVAHNLQPGIEHVQKAREVLAANDDRLKLIHRAASCLEYVVRHEAGDDPADLVTKQFPVQAKIRDYARWLTYESAVLLEDGRPIEAIRAAADGFSLARHLCSGGNVISYLTAGAIDSITLGALRRILLRSGNEPAVASAVRNAIETRRTEFGLAAALRNDTVGTLGINQSIRKDLRKYVFGNPDSAFKEVAFKDTAGFRTWRVKFGYPADPEAAGARFLDMNDAHYLSYIRRIVAVIDRPYPEAKAAVHAIVLEAEKASRHPDSSFAGMSFASSQGLTRVKAARQAATDVVRASAAVLEWKGANGHFPERLEEAVSTVPLDPFDLQPLRYRREADGFVVYSVGESGKFDGQPVAHPKHREAMLRYPPIELPNSTPN